MRCASCSPWLYKTYLPEHEAFVVRSLTEPAAGTITCSDLRHIALHHASIQVTVTATQPSGLKLSAPVAATVTITADSATSLLACAPAAVTITVSTAAPSAHVHVACFDVGTTVNVTASLADSIIIYAGQGVTVTIDTPAATAILLICPSSATLSLGATTNPSVVRRFTPAEATAVTSPDAALTEALDTGACALSSAQFTDHLLTDLLGTVTVTPATPEAATYGTLIVMAPAAQTVSAVMIP